MGKIFPTGDRFDNKNTAKKQKTIAFYGKLWYNKKAAKVAFLIWLLIPYSYYRTVWVINQEGGGNNE